jgi:hypothetical protein
MPVRADRKFKHPFDTQGKSLSQKYLLDFTGVLFPRHAASLTGAGGISARAETCLGSCQSFRIPGARLFEIPNALKRAVMAEKPAAQLFSRFCLRADFKSAHSKCG